MRKLLFVLLSGFTLLSCQKELDEEGYILPPVNNISFPGALDSIYAYSDVHDSTDFRVVFIYKIWYDSLKRVIRIDYDNRSYNKFVYVSNSLLPSKMIDVYPDRIAMDTGKISVDSFSYRYDSQNRVIEKRVQNYLIDYGIMWPRYAERITEYEYGNGFIFEGTACRSDSIIVNSSGDPVKKIHNCFISNPYQERVDEYYSYKNPFATLNIAPIKQDLYGYNNILWYPLDDVDYNINEPTFLYKKISGYYYYNVNPGDDKKEIRFHPVADANGRVSEFTIANSLTETDFNGDISVSTFYSRFRFFYHP